MIRPRTTSMSAQRLKGLNLGQPGIATRHRRRIVARHLRISGAVPVSGWTSELAERLEEFLSSPHLVEANAARGEASAAPAPEEGAPRHEAGAMSGLDATALGALMIPAFWVGAWCWIAVAAARKARRRKPK